MICKLFSCFGPLFSEVWYSLQRTSELLLLALNIAQKRTINYISSKNYLYIEISLGPILFNTGTKSYFVSVVKVLSAFDTWIPFLVLYSHYSCLLELDSILVGFHLCFCFTSSQDYSYLHISLSPLCSMHIKIQSQAFLQFLARPCSFRYAARYHTFKRNLFSVDS